jgi:hypothetical protein
MSSTFGLGLTWRHRVAIRDAAPYGAPSRLEGRLKPLHGSDVQDWLVANGLGGPGNVEAFLDDMVQRGMLRRLGKFLVQRQELAKRASSASGWADNSPLHFWYEALAGPPCPWYRAPAGE